MELISAWFHNEDWGLVMLQPLWRKNTLKTRAGEILRKQGSCLQPEDLSSVPGAHIVEGENRSLQVVL